MYTIYLNSDKSLITTEKINLYQREKLIDKIQFVIPKEYNGFNLLLFTPYLKYVDQMNIVHAELLTISNDDYKENYFTCIVPVDTNLTKYAGNIVIHLQLTWVDPDTLKQYVLTSGKDVICISPVQDLYEFVPDESLDVITQKIGELNAKAEALELISNTYTENQVDDLELDKETDKLYVTAHGVRKGDGVEILVGENDGELDGKSDGIIDINELIDI